jgi:hypothetical protein
MDISHINWLAIIVAGLSAFMVGGIWYSKPLFGNAWMTDSNLTMEQIESIWLYSSVFACYGYKPWNVFG